jgi:hypothetical protein
MDSIGGQRLLGWRKAIPSVKLKTEMVRYANYRGFTQLPKGTGGARLFAALLIAALGFSQFTASWHEATVRHVRCAEHGELTDVAAASPQTTVPANARATIESSAGATSAGHDHCSVVFAFRRNADVQVVRVARNFETPSLAPRPIGDLAPRPGRAFILASAPKTSPPSA